jgi:glycosyltransferase involved in cell wall biosynthesis
LSSPGRRVFVYHNITPDTFFEGYNEDARRLTKEARARLGEFRSVDLALGDSAYNCQELKELGYKNVSEVPILVSFDDFKKTQPALEVLERYKDGWTNFLFVGRIAPNKRQDDVIRAFAHYHHHIDSRSRLLLVGGKNGMERYDDALRALARALGVQDHVVFSGHTRFDELVAYYQVSHIFLSMSEHEGFCVPLLEAMWHGIPILAFKSSAIPGTLGAAGWLLREKNPVIAAHACHLLVKDPVIRARVQATQYARLADFQPAPIASLFRSALESLAGNQPAKQA